MPPKADRCSALGHVCFGSLAGIRAARDHVRFTPESDIQCVTMGCPLRANSGHSSTHAGHRRELVRFVEQGFAQNHVQRCLGRWQPVSSVLTSALFGLHIERQRTISGLGDPRRPVATGIVAANPSPVRARVKPPKRTLWLDRTKITRRFCVLRGEKNLRTKKSGPLSGRLSDCIRGLFWLRPSPRLWQRIERGQ